MKQISLSPEVSLCVPRVSNIKRSLSMTSAKLVGIQIWDIGRLRGELRAVIGHAN